jgi:hypothetical protein
MGNYLIRNQTPHQLLIEGANVVKLAPLQRRNESVYSGLWEETRGLTT